MSGRRYVAGQGYVRDGSVAPRAVKPAPLPESPTGPITTPPRGRLLVWVNRAIQAISFVAVGWYLLQVVRGVDVSTEVFALVGISVLVSVGSQFLVLRMEKAAGVGDPDPSARRQR
jgi:hypothetical protein